ncbi:hypothetical protein CEXT_8861 [Caerostris extrusa]|uniref:Uncharacterized protein n=1 Tax=Caerostris extrusa TaxID=172846 RepID=A0AAV4QUF7_CAEEX|nr:hypothetical protein CEXT_8861 [Caerostris extrusa]
MDLNNTSATFSHFLQPYMETTATTMAMDCMVATSSFEGYGGNFSTLPNSQQQPNGVLKDVIGDQLSTEDLHFGQPTKRYTAKTFPVKGPKNYN